jgi:hypothetical protein
VTIVEIVGDRHKARSEGKEPKSAGLSDDTRRTYDRPRGPPSKTIVVCVVVWVDKWCCRCRLLF